MTDKTNIAKNCLKQLKDNHASILLDCRIPASVKVTESQLFGRPVVDYKPSRKVAKAFKHLAKLIEQELQ